MAKRIRYLILALTFACGGLPSRAQLANPDPAVRQVALEFSVSCRDVVSGLVYRPARGRPCKPVTFYGGYRARPISYKGAARMEFFDQADAASENPQPVAICNVPEGITSALLLFLPKAQPTAEGLKFDVVAINDSLEKVPPGSFAVINVTNNDYAAQYGTASPITISRGVNPFNRASGQVILRLAVRDGVEWINAGRRSLDLTKQNRVWVILYPPPGDSDVGPIIDTLTQELSLPTEKKEATVASIL
jgi:hypothetical protein